MRRPSVDSVIKQHSKIIAETGGSDGLRDENLLDSAINSTFQTFGGNELYPTLYDKAAHIAYALIENHPFSDGNKRIGVTVMAVFLRANGSILSCSDKELEQVGLGVATGDISQEELKEWIRTHT